MYLLDYNVPHESRNDARYDTYSTLYASCPSIPTIKYGVPGIPEERSGTGIPYSCPTAFDHHMLLVSAERTPGVSYRSTLRGTNCSAGSKQDLSTRAERLLAPNKRHDTLRTASSACRGHYTASTAFTDGTLSFNTLSIPILRVI